MPPSFAYFGDLPLGKTWGFTPFSTHRDADALMQSNWGVISEDLLRRFPDDFEVLSSSHWAVGSCEQLLVRVLNDDGSETEAFQAAEKWATVLRDYPVADDTHHSELEQNELIEYVESIGGQIIDHEKAPDNWAIVVIGDLYDDYSVHRVDELNYDWIEEILDRKEWLDTDE